MYSRILLIALLGLMTSACAPYYESGGYYRSDYYSTDRYVSPGYYRYDRYYVAPQPPAGTALLLSVGARAAIPAVSAAGCEPVARQPAL